MVGTSFAYELVIELVDAVLVVEVAFTFSGLLVE
jgi:hypothetical protein